MNGERLVSKNQKSMHTEGVGGKLGREMDIVVLAYLHIRLRAMAYLGLWSHAHEIYHHDFFQSNQWILG